MSTAVAVSRTGHIVFAAFIIITSFLLILSATHWGAGMTPDSVAYIMGARSIIANANLTELSPHWPPVYAISLALLGAAQADVLGAARWGHVFFHVASTAMIGYVIYRQTKGARLWSLVGMLVFTTSHAVLAVYMMAWSEALFLLFSLLGLYFLANHVETRRPGRSNLWLSALFVGLAFATRYAGVALVAAGALSLLVFTPVSWRARVRDCLIFVAAGSSLCGLWLLRNLDTGASATNRSLIYHPVTEAHVDQAIDTVSHWFQLPAGEPLLALLVTLGIVVLYGRSVAVKVNSTGRLCDISMVFISVYFLFLLTSISFFDAHTPLDNRILSPILLLVITSVPIMASRLPLTGYAGKVPHFLCLMLSVLLAALQTVEMKRALPQYIDNGIGFASKPWINSQTLAYLDRLPTDAVVYSNGPDPIRLLLGRETRMIPTMTLPNTREQNLAFPDEIQDMTRALTTNGGAIAYFFGITWRWYLPSPAVLGTHLPALDVYRLHDGLVIPFPKETDREST